MRVDRFQNCYCSLTQLCPTLCDPTDCSISGFPILHYLPEFAQIHVYWVMMTSNHHMLYSPLLFLPLVFPSIRIFSSELALLIRWPNYGSFRFSISSFNEYSGLISFRIDWFDLLAVQGTLQSPAATQFKRINSLVLSFLAGQEITVRIGHGTMDWFQIGKEVH